MGLFQITKHKAYCYLMGGKLQIFHSENSRDRFLGFNNRY